MTKLILVAPAAELYEAFCESFDHLPYVEVVHNYFECLTEFDCLVSPANSFGMMDGGITKFFGIDLEWKVKSQILDTYGEQPIGTSMIVETGHPQHLYLAHTPTMRVPMIVKGTDIPYSAMWAML